MPPIIHDYPSIKKALLGDSWWTAKPKPKPEPEKDISFLVEHIKAASQSEHVDVFQGPRANTGGTLRIRFPADYRPESASSSRPAIAIASDETDELISP